MTPVRIPSSRGRMTALACLLMALPAPALAEVPPDAGQLLERSREPLQLQPLQAPRIDTPAPAQPGVPAEVAFIPVRQLRITGASAFSEATLQAVVADAIGRTLTFAELQALAGRLTRFYGERGYLLARAYLPPQEIREGQIEIAVLEGRLEAVEYEQEARLRAGLLPPLQHALRPGAPLRRQDLERTVLLLDNLPGIAATARLQPGAATGGTVVVLKTRREQAVAGEVTVDNHGDRYTGDLQGGVRLEWNNPGAIGDQLALRLQSGGEGRVYGRLAYDRPLDGALRLTLAASSTRYELGEEFRSLEADGWARTGSLELRYPFILSGRLRLSGFAGVDHMALVDRINTVGSVRDKDLTAGRVGINLQAADAWRGQTALMLQFTMGRVDIHDATEQALDAVTVGSEGGFGKANLALERRQPLPGAVELRGSASLQGALGNLTSAQKQAIGGPEGVRAYPTGEAQGDHGQLYSLELRRALPPRHAPVAVVFADYGRVELNDETWTGFAGNTTRELSAAGVGLEWSGPWGLWLSAYQAWPLSNQPVTAEPDSNHRTWVSGRLRF